MSDMQEEFIFSWENESPCRLTGARRRRGSGLRTTGAFSRRISMVKALLFSLVDWYVRAWFLRHGCRHDMK